MIGRGFQPFCLSFGKLQRLGIITEKINTQSLGHEGELLRVDDGLLKDLVYGADVHIDAFRQPTVVLALATQLVADELPNGNGCLHCLCFCVSAACRTKRVSEGPIKNMDNRCPHSKVLGIPVVTDKSRPRSHAETLTCSCYNYLEIS